MKALVWFALLALVSKEERDRARNSGAIRVIMDECLAAKALLVEPAINTRAHNGTICVKD